MSKKPSTSAAKPNTPPANDTKNPPPADDTKNPPPAGGDPNTMPTTTTAGAGGGENPAAGDGKGKKSKVTVLSERKYGDRVVRVLMDDTRVWKEGAE